MLIGFLWVSVPIAVTYLSNKLQDTALSKATYQVMVTVIFLSKTVPPAINSTQWRPASSFTRMTLMFLGNSISYTTKMKTEYTQTNDILTADRKSRQCNLHYQLLQTASQKTVRVGATHTVLVFNSPTSYI